MKVELLKRTFSYNGVNLVDPDPVMTPEAVRDFYSAMYPEITTAVVEGPEDRNGKLAYSFRKSVGTKA
jgi:PRTRC genetic system protein C